MGEAEIIQHTHRLFIRARFFFYGEAASRDLAIQIADDVARHWNEPRGHAIIRGEHYEVIFETEAMADPGLPPETVWYNTDPMNNYFRIESFSLPDISFVDGLGSNTGYFKLDNLLHNSTTAAHEFGHTLGLDHPANTDIRGKGQPAIMYPRGTICDPAFQYDPLALPLQPGGTMNPFYRKVLASDIDSLQLHSLRFSASRKAVLGDFSSLYHEKHLPSV